MDAALRPEELSRPCTAAPWARQGLCPPDGLLTGEQGLETPLEAHHSAHADRGLHLQAVRASPDACPLLFSGVGWACRGRLPRCHLDQTAPKQEETKGAYWVAGASWAALSWTGSWTPGLRKEPGRAMAGQGWCGIRLPRLYEAWVVSGLSKGQVRLDPQWRWTGVCASGPLL